MVVITKRISTDIGKEY